MHHFPIHVVKNALQPAAEASFWVEVGGLGAIRSLTAGFRFTLGKEGRYD